MLAPHLLRHLLDTRGGFTLCPVTGVAVGEGVSVAVAPHLGTSFPRAAWQDERVAAWLRRCARARTVHRAPGPFIGGWLDGTSGQVWLDVVCVVRTPDRALRVARAARQRWVYDLARCALLPAERPA